MKETSTEHYKTLARILGRKYFKGEIESPFDFIQIASKGISAKAIVNFRKHFDLPRDTTADMLQVSEPTIYRWVREDKKLERNHSVQLFELADLFLYGTKLFSGKDPFRKWLNLPHTALSGMEPIKLLEIPEGVSKVRDLLGRIEYGIYS
jgi:putative toxin-antitoxin system antitoxin component (TIGR02293 family)